jgi:molybdopterin converting factor small subunit
VTRIRVRTFAHYSEVLGGSLLEVEVSEPATVASLIHALRQLPGGDLLPPTPLVALNLSLAQTDDSIGFDDEIALLPPLAGG